MGNIKKITSVMSKSTFEFRVANKMFGSNSGTLKGCLDRVAQKFGTHVKSYDDSIGDVFGFGAKATLGKSVDVHKFTELIKNERNNASLLWGRGNDCSICYRDEFTKTICHELGDIGANKLMAYLK